MVVISQGLLVLDGGEGGHGGGSTVAVEYSALAAKCVAAQAAEGGGPH